MKKFLFPFTLSLLFLQNTGVMTMHTSEIGEERAHYFTHKTVSELIRNPANDPEIETLRNEISRIAIEKCRHGWWLWSAFNEEELYNEIVQEIIRYVGKTSYQSASSYLARHPQVDQIARQTSITIAQELQNIILQVDQHNKISGGHISPYIGKKLRSKVAQHLESKGYVLLGVNSSVKPKPNNQAQQHQCPICFESYAYHRPQVNLDCGHNFCRPCLLKQYQVEGGRKLRCAVCRTHIDTERYANIFHSDPAKFGNNMNQNGNNQNNY